MTSSNEEHDSQDTVQKTNAVQGSEDAVIGGHDFSHDVVLVAGLGISGRSVESILSDHGVRTISVDERNGDADRNSFDDLPWEDITLVVTSPGFPPATAFLQEAASRAIPVWSEVEFAWRTRVSSTKTGAPAPWIGITGTNGKTTTTEMTSAILNAAGLKVPAVGNIGEPVSRSVLDPTNDGLTVELSSFALHFTQSLALDVAIWTNVAADHLDWHGGFAKYAADKSKVFTHASRAIIYNADDDTVARYAATAPVAPGCLKVGFTLGEPEVGQIGVVDGWMVDRSELSVHLPDVDGGLLVSLKSLSNLSEPNGAVYPHLLADCMAATAAALAMKVPLADIRATLSSFTLDAHRIQLVESYVPTDNSAAAPIRFIDDSKATNAHAAAASLSSFADDSVVWIAGGLAKGARFEDLIASQRHVMKAAVLIGVDQDPFLQAFSASAPDLPVTRISPSDSKADVMRDAIDAAMKYATPGTVVLMAPATASMDQFTSYVDRGNQFADQAHAWVSQHA
ncbi:MAG: UDP-N-acetylmuramoyl-L-alanine--D-glutamate ligase [Bifidobacteriaceae bacterium]|jgi:UDP-N-acetylmuramoylalanine--D-glutamate ligase|nr:UDP-N-acetylmuramoyl-L-alanine--D-glutamate ligase [Bifidobacteriaceae bacterium]